ncbi:MAG: ABC transporter permease subunit [Candidatus Lokiarchaeota archaeon]|nr:ABC transporter permease subunit [Candidatus Lokiarchaeota archaeon]
MRKKKLRLNYSIYFILPALVIYIIFNISPLLAGFVYSFTNWTSISPEIKFIGIEQFKRIFSLNYFGLALKNTIFFTVSTTAFRLALGLMLALILNRAMKSKNILRSIFFVPTLINNIVLGLVFQKILADQGLLNRILTTIGLDVLSQGWLTDPSLAIWSVSFLEIWKWTGQMMIIFLAGLQGVPHEYYEAADIDGANAIKKFRHVTFPLIRPSFNINLLICLIWGIRVFDIVFALTGGGPGRASEVLNTIVFEALGNGFYGYGAAVNLIIVIMIIGISLPLLKFLKRGETEL